MQDQPPILADGFDGVYEATIARANTLFEEMCRQRHETGELDYGHNTFIANDTLQMLLEELVDTSNTARYTFVRLLILNERLVNEMEGQGVEVLGAQAFKGTGEGWKKE